MKMVTISEFQSVTGLSNNALLWLIKNNKLSFEYNKNKGLLIDSGQVTKNQLIQAMLHKEISLLEQDKAIIKERLSHIVSNHLEEFLDEALAHMLEK